MNHSNDTHLKSVGYILWIFGFTGSHRFYYGKPVTGTIWFFTLGLLFIGWIIDLFLIPSMDRKADLRYFSGRLDYTVAWTADVSRIIRHTPFLYGKVGHGNSVPAVRRHLRYRVSV